MNIKPKPKKSRLVEWRDALVFAIVVASLFRWSMAEAYVIPTGSMENSLLVGDYILVSKLHYGPRTPSTPLQVPLTHQKIWGTDIPSYLDFIQLPSYRLPGISKIQRGETVVFNVPKDLLDPTERPMDLMTYLVKRCVAIPGDVMEIRDGLVYTNGESMTNPTGLKYQYQISAQFPLQKHHLETMGLDGNDFISKGYSKNNKAIYHMLLTERQLENMRSNPNIKEIVPIPDLASGFPLFPSKMNKTWSGKNYGPLTVPKTGMTIQINPVTLDLYGEIMLKHEGFDKVKVSEEKLTINGKQVTSYTFQQDYYFMMGDSRDSSIDSRYWGFVPEDHVVGKPILVLFSKNEEGKGFERIRWERIFSRID